MSLTSKIKILIFSGVFLLFLGCATASHPKEDYLLNCGALKLNLQMVQNEIDSLNMAINNNQLYMEQSAGLDATTYYFYQLDRERRRSEFQNLISERDNLKWRFEQLLLVYSQKQCGEETEGSFDPSEFRG